MTMSQIIIEDSTILGLELYKQLKANQFYGDVVIISSEREEITAHGCVLGANSAFIRKSLEEQVALGNSSAKLYVETGITVAVLETILEFVYTAKLITNTSQIHQVQEAADALEIKRLQNILSSFKLPDLTTKTTKEDTEGGLQVEDSPAPLEEGHVTGSPKSQLDYEDVGEEPAVNIVTELKTDSIIQEEAATEPGGHTWITNLQQLLQQVPGQLKTGGNELGADDEEDATSTAKQEMSHTDAEGAATTDKIYLGNSIVFTADDGQLRSNCASEYMTESLQTLELEKEDNRSLLPDVLVSKSVPTRLQEEFDLENATQEALQLRVVATTSDGEYPSVIPNVQASPASQTKTGGNPGLVFENGGVDWQGITHYRCSLCKEMCTDIYEHANMHRSQRPYHCTSCNKSYKKNSHLSQHMLVAHGTDKECSCPECGKTFRNPYLMKRHFTSVCNNVKSYLCPICKKNFRSSNNLNYHIATHSNSRNFKCSLCPKSYASSKQLKTHQVYHQQNGCTCFCGKVFSSGKLYKAHFRYKHAPPAEFQCQICRKTCGTKGHLRNHLKSHQRPYACQICLKGYKDERQCRQHELACKLDYNSSASPGTPGDHRMRTCPVCRATFTSLREMEKHMEEHSGITVYSCPDCTKDFKSFQAFLNHHRTHFTPRIACPYCGKTFLRQTTFHLHMKSHSKENTCSLCGESFSLQKGLEMHMERHKTMAVFQYPCSFCDESFSTVSGVTCHQETKHTQTCEASCLPCHMCDKVLNLEESFAYHVRSYHPKMFAFCESCQLIFLTPLALQKHQAVKHKSSDTPFACEHCSWNFYDEEALARHKSLSHVEGSKSQLAHMFSTKSKMCFICLDSFQDARKLVEHEKIHLEAKPIHCPFCAYTSENILQVKSHAKRCSKIRRCKICCIQFPSMAQLQKHLRMHKKGAVVYACNNCPEKFEGIDELKRHKNYTCLGGESSLIMSMSETSNKNLSVDKGTTSRSAWSQGPSDSDMDDSSSLSRGDFTSIDTTDQSDNRVNDKADNLSGSKNLFSVFQ